MTTTKTRGKGFTTLSVRVTKDEARSFARVASKRGKTSKALLRDLVRNSSSDSETWRIR